MAETTITICGSMAFSEQMVQLRQALEQQEFRVFTPVDEEGTANYNSLSDREQAILKRQFIDSHLEKIKKSDAVLIANFAKRGIDGYIGANTLMEMAFAYAFHKQVIILYPVGEQQCKVEALGLQTANLAGHLENLRLLQS